MKRMSVPMEELMPILQLQMETAGSAVLHVTGYSMMPMLRHKQDSVVLSLMTESPKKGDLMLYRRENGAYILHRILKKKPEHYICCGDNQFQKETVKESQMLAVVTAFTRKGKKISIDSKGYRLYVKLWVALHPIRWMYLIPRRLLGKCRAFLRHKRRKA